MPITDNNFTGEELAAALVANPALSDIVVGTSLENADIRAKLEPGFIGPKTKEWATAIERDVFETTGIVQNKGEKYHDYLKRAYRESHAAKDAELTLLKDKTNPSAADKARIEQLEKALTDKDTEYSGKLTEREKEIANIRILSTLESALTQVKVKPGLPDDLVEIAKQSAIADIAKIAQVQDDKTVTFLDADGKVLLSKSTYKPLTALEMLNEKLKTIVDNGKQQPGAGSSGEGGQPGGDDSGKFTGVPATVTTQVQLTEHLLKLGILAGTAEFDKIWAEHASKLKLR